MYGLARRALAPLIAHIAAPQRDALGGPAHRRQETLRETHRGGQQDALEEMAVDLAGDAVTGTIETDRPAVGCPAPAAVFQAGEPQHHALAGPG